MSGITPSQTVGPYFGIMLRGRVLSRQASAATAGTRMVVEGQVLDGAGQVIPDALVETWQADANGNYRHEDDRHAQAQAPDPAFYGYGWAHTQADGGFRFETVKPGRVSGPDGRDQAPHILASVMARGILTRFVTRIYFEDEEAANSEDTVLALVPDDRRHTLMARRTAEGSYRFNLVMQGPGETVFFDV